MIKDKTKGALFSIALYLLQIALGLFMFYILPWLWLRYFFLAYAAYNTIAFILFLISYLVSHDEKEDKIDDQDYDKY